MADILKALTARQELTEEQLRGIMSAMMAGRSDEAETAAFLVGLRMKGETAQEIAWAAAVLREHMVRWDAGRPGLLDTCGTGGDGSGTFNISTATALVAAAAGVPVVKHGNRSVSSRSGSADVLSALGIKIDGDAEFARQSLRETNFAFCFAPQFHPALKHVAGIRRRLGIPTIFNCLGPLANPASAAHQMLGVGRPELLDRMAGALVKLGGGRSFVLCSRDGLDEVSLSAPTLAWEVHDGRMIQHEWNPEDFGLARCMLAELFAPHAQASAAIIHDVLTGVEGPAQRIVLANAAVALLAAEKASTLRDGVAAARTAITSGRARRVMEILRALT